MWVNADGEQFWVKYHFKTDQGIEFLTQDEADQLAGVDADYHQRDLFDAIERGDHPSWTLKMQIMPFEDAKTYRFNPFDLTKVWPHGDYPLIEVGKLTLNRNVDRLPHRDRAGGVRAEQPRARAPACRPTRCCWPAGSPTPTRTAPGSGSTTSRSRSTSRSRRCTATPRTARCASPTSPTRCTRPTPTAARRPTRSATDGAGLWAADGEMVRTAYTLRADDDDWGQAGTLVREVMDDAQRDRLVANVVGHLSDGVSEPVLLRAFEYWQNVDAEIGARIEQAVRAG